MDKQDKPFIKCICPQCKRIVLLREHEIEKAKCYKCRISILSIVDFIEYLAREEE